MRQAVLLAIGALVTAIPAARAAEPPVTWEPGNATTSPVSPEVAGDETIRVGDGVHGRFDGELDLGAQGGAQIDEAVSGTLGVTAHYYSMAGVFVRGAQAFTDDADWKRSLSFGIDVKPVFVPRWALDAHSGHPFWDLTLDSISLELGAFVADPGERVGDERGFEASLGIGVPLFARAAGLWLDGRGLLRWRDPTASSDGPDAAALLALSWHWIVPVR